MLSMIFYFSSRAAVRKLNRIVIQKMVELPMRGEPYGPGLYPVDSASPVHLSYRKYSIIQHE